MTYYVITDLGVQSYRSLNQLKKEISIDKEEFVQLGTDYVMYMTDHSFEVTKDVRLLERVASKKVFTKDKMDLTNMLQILTLIVVYLVAR